ncbi:hypothetical protein V2J09_008901 [Rumex salicifolius]
MVDLFLGDNMLYVIDKQLIIGCGWFTLLNIQVRRELFNTILKGVTAANPFFEQKRDCTYRLGLTLLVKKTSAMRMLTYACPTDTLDEWMKIVESTDVERKFALLQGKFAMVKQPARFWDRGYPGKIMMTCIILHNIIIQDERGLNLPKWQSPSIEKRIPKVILPNEDYIDDIVARTEDLRSRVQNALLNYDLIVHQWNDFGSH